MDQIFDRLGRLIRSWGQGESSEDRQGMDPDTWAAYQELEEELGKSSRKPAGGSESRSAYRPAATNVPADIQAAYKVLGLDPGLDLEAAKKAHKFLILKNHPDRFASDPQRYKEATEATQRINQAFQKVKEYLTLKG